MDNYSHKTKKKINLINELINKIKGRKIKHKKKHRKLKKINTILNITIHGLNAVSVSAIVISFSGFPPIVILSLITSSLATIIGVSKEAYGFDHKIQSHNTAYLQYQDLELTTQNKILRNNMSADDYTILLDDINAKLGLISDSAEPISTSEQL